MWCQEETLQDVGAGLLTLWKLCACCQCVDEFAPRSQRKHIELSNVVEDESEIDMRDVNGGKNGEHYARGY